jgi:hypothetical protein
MNKWWLTAFAPTLVLLALGQPAGTTEEGEELVKKVTTADPGGANDAKGIEGLWYGSWGGGDVNGVVYQPVMAELFIAGDHVELCGFPNVSKLTGSVRFDASVKRMRITPTAVAGGQPAKAIDYAYQIEADELTLIDSDKSRLTLERQPVVRDPLADVRVNLVAASGINAAGDLLVTEFTMLRAGQAKVTYFEPTHWPLKTKQATILRVQEAGCRQLTLDEARRQIREPSLVVVAYRRDDRPKRHQLHGLWKDIGPPAPDSDAVLQTFSRILRPGTLIFVLSARENVVEP